MARKKIRDGFTLQERGEIGRKATESIITISTRVVRFNTLATEAYIPEDDFKWASIYTNVDDRSLMIDFTKKKGDNSLKVVRGKFPKTIKKIDKNTGKRKIHKKAGELTGHTHISCAHGLKSLNEILKKDYTYTLTIDDDIDTAKDSVRMYFGINEDGTKTKVRKKEVDKDIQKSKDEAKEEAEKSLE